MLTRIAGKQMGQNIACTRTSSDTMFQSTVLLLLAVHVFLLQSHAGHGPTTVPMSVLLSTPFAFGDGGGVVLRCAVCVVARVYRALPLPCCSHVLGCAISASVGEEVFFSF